MDKQQKYNFNPQDSHRMGDLKCLVLFKINFK